MAKKPSVTKLVDFDALYLQDNVRTSACEDIPQMVGSLRKNGFKPNHPLVVSSKPDNRFLVLCGNRRALGLTALRNADPAEFTAAVGSAGKVPCIIYTGLTEDEEILIRVDHSKDEDRVALDEWSEFRAIKQLVRAYPGESQSEIADKLGIISKKGKNKGKPNRSYVQPRVSLARLPVFVQNEYEKLCTAGKDATPVRWNDVKALYTVFNAEYLAGHVDGDGPEFSAAWDKLINPEPEQPSDSDSSEQTAKALTPENAVQRSQSASSSTVKRILLAVTDQGGDMVALDAQVASFEADSQALSDIREFLGPNDYADLVSQARDARLAREMTAKDDESVQPEQPENADQTEDSDQPAEPVQTD
jgi:hypothetical protein